MLTRCGYSLGKTTALTPALALSVKCKRSLQCKKRDWLLAALVPHHPNLVDNMTTEDNLTFSQLKVRLHSLSSNVDKRAGTALVTTSGNQSRKRRFDTGRSPPIALHNPALGAKRGSSVTRGLSGKTAGSLKPPRMVQILHRVRMHISPLQILHYTGTTKGR